MLMLSKIFGRFRNVQIDPWLHRQQAAQLSYIVHEYNNMVDSETALAESSTRSMSWRHNSRRRCTSKVYSGQAPAKPANWS